MYNSNKPSDASYGLGPARKLAIGLLTAGALLVPTNGGAVDLPIPNSVRYETLNCDRGMFRGPINYFANPDIQLVVDGNSNWTLFDNNVYLKQRNGMLGNNNCSLDCLVSQNSVNQNGILAESAARLLGQTYNTVIEMVGSPNNVTLAYCVQRAEEQRGAEVAASSGQQPVPQPQPQPQPPRNGGGQI